MMRKRYLDCGKYSYLADENDLYPTGAIKILN